MDFKMTPENKINLTTRCRPVFLKDGEEDQNARGAIKDLVEKFFDSHSVKHFSNYVLPCIDLWI